MIAAEVGTSAFYLGALVTALLLVLGGWRSLRVGETGESSVFACSALGAIVLAVVVSAVPWDRV